ncbi:YigZ family protein [Leucobacter sp. CSA1]|uniref:YigZ family protein n=1 Tax=Leucobacter chromiisoli TaxID=2796471 RepID=A0A934Q7Q7_9MICO|nr:YigZ family protein [Leucobacter chromiisoli]MBK0418636.1 YigZ family protein [Leucobacter chromiisoli]
MAQEYETVAGPIDTEIEISRSRFLTRLERVDDEEGARAVIAAARAEHPRARHHCSAFVLGPDGRVQRSNDDGEPSGTAGAPMLDALVSAGLSDVVVVVTRYFGGVLLGAGGLTRAYRAAVAESVQAATRVRRGLRREAAVAAAYDVAPQIEAEARRRGLAVGEAQYGAQVSQTYLVPEDRVPELRAVAAELSAGSAEVTLGTATYVDLPVG